MPSHVQGCEDLPYKGYPGVVKVFTWSWSSKPKCTFLFLIKLLFFPFLLVCTCAHSYTHTHTLPKSPDEDIKPPQVSVIVGCEPDAMGLALLDASPLEEQQVLITTKLPLQQPFLFLNLYLVPTLNLQLRPNNYTVNEEDRPLSNTSLFFVMQLIFKLALIEAELKGNSLLTHVHVKQPCEKKKNSHSARSSSLRNERHTTVYEVG